MPPITTSNRPRAKPTGITKSKSKAASTSKRSNPLLATSATRPPRKNTTDQRNRSRKSFIDDAASISNSESDDDDEDDEQEEETRSDSPSALELVDLEPASLAGNNNETSSEADMLLLEVSSSRPPLAIPPDLIHAILNHTLTTNTSSASSHPSSSSPSSKHKPRISSDARDLVARYIEVFAREAVARCVFEKTEKSEERQKGGEMWLEVDDLEAVAVQLGLDF